MFKEIKAEQLQDNAFQMIGKDWLLVSAGNPEKANAMTASWGGVGIMWGKNVAYLVIRPQRFTKKFIDSEETVAVNVLPESFRDVYKYMGSVSGYQEDKIAHSQLTTLYDGQTPYFEEARLVLLCKKLFAQDYKPESFLDQSILERWYPDKDYHTLYICEIEKVLVKE